MGRGIVQDFLRQRARQHPIPRRVLQRLNRANFTGQAGSCTATGCDSTRATVSAGGFGSIRAAADPRIGQLALKLLF
jgi:hypothetical protein